MLQTTALSLKQVVMPCQNNLAAGLTQLALVYDAKTYKVTGEYLRLITRKNCNEIDDDAQVSCEGDLMNLYLHVMQNFHRREGYYLDIGKLFSLPAKPEGDYVKVELITKDYCVNVN